MDTEANTGLRVSRKKGARASDKVPRVEGTRLMNPGRKVSESPHDRGDILSPRV